MNDELINRYGLINRAEGTASYGEMQSKAEFKAVFSDLISSDPALFKEIGKLEGTEAAIGVARMFDANGHETLLFDSGSVTENEVKTLEEFTSHFTAEENETIANYKDRLSNTRFEWYFKNHDEEFLKHLVELAELRLTSLRAGDSSDRYLKSKSLTKTDELARAADAFREMAKRRTVKDAIKKQIDALPIKVFQGIDAKTGDIVELAEDEVDFILTKNEDGESELLFFCNKPNKYKQIRPVYFPEDEQNDPSLKRFHRVAGTGEEKIVQKGKTKSDDLSYYEFRVDEGNAPVQPLFTIVKVFSVPRNITKDLTEYEEEQEDYLSKLPGMPIRKGYQPSSPPSTPSYNNWSQPTTYVSSG